MTNLTDDQLNAVLDGHRVDDGAARLARLEANIMAEADALETPTAPLFAPLNWREGLGAVSAVALVAAVVLILSGPPPSDKALGLEALYGTGGMLSGEL